MRKETMAEIAARILKKENCPGVMWGDCYLLDEIASEFVRLHPKSNLMDTIPWKRHPRVLTMLEKSPLFEKGFVNYPGKRGNGTVRYFKLKEMTKDA